MGSIISNYIEELKKSVQSKIDSNNMLIEDYSDEETLWEHHPPFKSLTKAEAYQLPPKLVTKYSEENKVLQTKLDWLNELSRFYTPPSKIGFLSIEDAIDYYWDESRNPHGSYEVDYELSKGEQSFCESEGFDWNEWGEKKRKKFLENLDN